MQDKVDSVKAENYHVDDIEADAPEKPSASAGKGLTAFQSIKMFPVATAWCCYMLFICIMWGYDGLAGSIVLSIPRFRQDYGFLYNGEYVVSAPWQMAFTGGSMGGLVIGAAVGGLISERWGQKASIMGGYIFTVAGVFAQWYSPGDLPLFFAGKLLTGIPLGLFLAAAPVYTAEVAPVALRGSMIAAVNFSIVIGQLIGYGVMRQVQGIDGPDSYRTMYAVQWGFAAVGIALIWFLPESPMRLLARGKEEDARKSITVLYQGHIDADTEIAELKAALANAAESQAQAGGIKQCFDAKNRIRTLVALSVFFFQASSGVSWIVGYMGYFMQLSGMEGIEVFDTTVGIAGAMAIGSITSWWTVGRFGRRGTILFGMVACTICLFLISILAQFVNKGRPVVLTQVAFMALWAFMYQATIGSVGYTLMAEVPTSNLRGLTQSMATMVNGISNSIWSLALPYMINPDQANMGGNVGWIFFALLLLGDVFAFFFYPETMGRTFEEIDELYSRGIPARHFKSTKLN